MTLESNYFDLPYYKIDLLDIINTINILKELY